jgi:prepilin-type N-terminal cleavage/methylation domain-containing protein
LIASQRGVSLVEILIVVAISSLIVVAAFTTYTGSYAQYRNSETKSLLSQDTLLLSNYISRVLEEVGGGSTRIWESLWIEDNATCANRAPFGPCNGADRVNLAILSYPAVECPITAYTAPNVYTINAAPTCCFTAALQGKQVMLTLNGLWSQQYVQIANAATCQITVANGQMSGNDNVAGLDPVNGFTGGIMSQMDVQTLYVDTVNNQLLSFVDANNNGAIDPGEVSLLADQVYDLQIALGYDFNPTDGTITDTQSNADEWTNNAAGANDALGAGFFLTATADQLRMIEFGLVLGTPLPATGAGNRVQILNGNVLTNPNSFLQGVLTKVAPRNLGVYQ